ncbi:Hypothetical predicted protein, partial [Paramuricea clavata]
MKATYWESESIAEKRARREKEAITDDEDMARNLGQSAFPFAGAKNFPRMINIKRKAVKSSRELFEVERVISRRNRRGKVDYYVKWKNYSSLENTWEPEENLNAAAIRAFENPATAEDMIQDARDSLACARHPGTTEIK